MLSDIDNGGVTTGSPRTSGRRTPSRRHYLMCPPTYFAVDYSINPWMDPGKPASRDLAMAQWECLYDQFTHLGHRIELLDPVPGLPDMVFAANGASVAGDRVLVARFRYPQRADEAAAYLAWFRDRGHVDVRQAKWTNEGQGDLLIAGNRILAGTGFRTVGRAHREAQEVFGLPVIGLTLVNPSYYHLDTALSVLDDDEVMYYPPAFSTGSRSVLRTLYPDAIVASDHDAAVLGLNAISDGRHVILPAAATGLSAQLLDRGFEPIGIDLSELLKAGGGVKCCTLELGFRDDGCDRSDSPRS